MKYYKLIGIMTIAAITSSCTGVREPGDKKEAEDFKFFTEQFADAKILRYQVPGFDSLGLKQKKLIYYLSQAALCGRDIIYDQNYRYNLLIRKTLEAIYTGFSGDRNSEDFKKFEVYLKQVWFNNGIHHHYSTDKFFPEFTQSYFSALVRGTKPALLPLSEGQSQKQFLEEISLLIFSQEVAPKRVCLDPSKDLVLCSASNFYNGVNQKEAEDFYARMKKEAKKNKKDTLVSFGLNSQLSKENGKISERIYKMDGLYGQAITQIVFWLEKALPETETSEQHASVEKLIAFYRSGNLVTWDEHNIAWVKDLNSMVDFISGFIEVYGDPLAMKGSWESMVNFTNVEATKRTQVLSENAQFFEDNSPVAPEFRKKVVKGVSAKVITVAQLGGESDPTTPIGINLPNASWIRKEYGSKSVTMDNITFAYDQASLDNGFVEEFAFSAEEISRSRKYGHLAGNLTTDLHECLGHGSGQLNRGVGADALKNYHSTIEEARADLFALYYIMDPVLVNFGLVEDFETARAAYDSFIRNGLMTQLVRVKPGKTIEESHMRDRALIARWIYEKSKNKKIIEKVTKDGKTYFKVNDYDNLRWQFGELLKVIQRITSEGDYHAARELVETYAVQVDPGLHHEVLERYAKLNIAPYTGFINPEYALVMTADTIADVKISYPVDFTSQMLFYSKNYSFLPAR
jgi:dipeptidyl-peptidase-3